MGHQSVCFPRLQFAILASALLLLCLKNSQARFPEAEGGTFVRIEAETAVASATEEKDIAFNHLRRWGLGSQRQFAEVAEPGTSAEVVMARAWTYSAVVIVVLGEQPPERRNVTAGQPFISVEPSLDTGEGNAADPLQSNLPLGAVNRGAQYLESFMSGPLFPVRLVTRSFEHSMFGEAGPVAVYDVSSGVVYLDRRVSWTIEGLSKKAQVALEAFSEQLFGGLGEHWGAQQRNASLGVVEEQGGYGGVAGVAGVAKVVARTAAAALAATMAAQVPVWFCIACPIVLGLLAPFVFNLGLTAVAEAVCQHYSLPDDQCNELWYGAFALAMVLSLASAIPIVFVCRLPDCAKGIARKILPYA